MEVQADPTDPNGHRSLDALLRKAIDLRSMLSSCALAPATSDDGRGAPPPCSYGDRDEYQQLLATEEASSLMTAPFGLDGTGMGSGREKENMAHYILTLEKRLRYYQSLVDDRTTTGEPRAPEASDGRGSFAGEVELERPSNGSLITKEDEGGAEIASEGRFIREKGELPNGREERVLLLVFAHLTTRELCVASSVCRRWRMVSQQPRLWKHVSIRNAVVSSEVLQRLAARCKQTESIKLTGLMPEMAMCDEDLSSYIQRVRGSLETGLATMLATAGETLQTLVISQCNIMITDRCLWLISLYCHQLKSITYSSDEFPAGSEGLWSLSHGCPFLTHISLPPVVESHLFERFDDNCLYQIALGWPNLLSVCAGGPSITHKGLLDIATQCTKLRKLELFHCPPLNTQAVSELCGATSGEAGIRLSSLHTLTLTFTRISPQAVVQFIKSCPSISEIVLHLAAMPLDASTDQTKLAKYQRVIANLKELEEHPRIGQVFHLHIHQQTRYFAD